MEQDVKETLLVLELKPLVPYKTKDEYMYAMKEDLAEWFTCLYKISINVENFFEILDTGVILCEHANKVRVFANQQNGNMNGGIQSNFVKGLQIPQYEVQYKINVKPQSFQARDNISNFISWTRNLGIPEVLSFETDDLVLRKNEKSVILCLLEVARVGAKLGMLAPTIVQMEEEIDAEIAGEPPPQIKTCDLKSLDEMVQDLAGRCTCPVQFSIIKVGEGKYKIGESQTLVFVRILRKHVMIRVGGGWDTLEHYLDKHDPCRCHFTGHRGSSSSQKSMVSRRSSTPTALHSQPLSMKSPRKMSVTPQPTQRPPSPARMRSMSPAPSPRKTSSQSSINSDQTRKKSSFENDDNCYGVNDKAKTLSRSQSPVPGRFRSPSPVQGIIKSDKVGQVVHNNRPASPIKQRRLSENVTVNRCTSPSPVFKRCVSESPAPVRKFRNTPEPQRCGSVSPAPVRKTGLSTVRATKSVDQARQLSQSQGSMDSTSSDKDGVSMDSISTMTLDQFKNLLNNALSVPNGDTSEGSSPRSQSSTDSYKAQSQHLRSRGNKRTSGSGGLANKTWTARKELSKSFDTGDGKSEKSWRSYTSRELNKTVSTGSENPVTIPRPKTPVSLSKSKPTVTSFKPALAPKPATSNLKQTSTTSSTVSPRVNSNYTRPKTPSSLNNSVQSNSNSVNTPRAREKLVTSQNGVMSPSTSSLSSPLSPTNSDFSAKLELALQNGPKTPESQRSILSPKSELSSSWNTSKKDSDYESNSNSSLSTNSTSTEHSSVSARKSREYTPTSKFVDNSGTSGGIVDYSERSNSASIKRSTDYSGTRSKTLDYSGFNDKTKDVSLSSKESQIYSKTNMKANNSGVSEKVQDCSRIDDNTRDYLGTNSSGGSNGIVKPAEHARPNVCYVTIKKGERNGQSFLAHIDTQVTRSVDYDNVESENISEERNKAGLKNYSVTAKSDISRINSDVVSDVGERRTNSHNFDTKEKSALSSDIQRGSSSFRKDENKSSFEKPHERSVASSVSSHSMTNEIKTSTAVKTPEPDVVIPRPSTPSLIPRPSTPSLIPRPSTPSLLPRPSTPVSVPKETVTKTQSVSSITKTQSVSSTTKPQPQRQSVEHDRPSGRPPTPRKATIIAKSPSAANSNQKVNTSSGSYANIYLNRRAITPGPKDMNLVTANDTSRDFTRRCITPGPNERYNRPSTPTKFTTSRSNSKTRNENELRMSSDNSIGSNQSVEFSTREIPSTEYDVPSSPAVERRRSNLNAGDSRSLKRQKAVEDNAVITVDRSGGKHEISVKEGNQVKYKTGQTSGARIIARSPSASQSQNTRNADDRGRIMSRAADVAQHQKQRPKSVEPQAFLGRRSSYSQGEEVLSVVRNQNGGHVVASRTEAWVASTANASKPKKRSSVQPRPRSKTPSLVDMHDSELQSRSLEEIKAALTLPINGLDIVDPVELDAPPEDPEAYAKMEQLFEALREKELKSSVNEIPGNSDFMGDIDIDCMENEDAEMGKRGALDMNENMKRKTPNSSRGSSVKASSNSSARGSVPSTPTRCKTPTLSRSSSSSQPIARPISTPPRPSTPTRLGNSKNSNTPKVQKVSSTPDRNCKTPVDHANVLVSKIKEMLNTKPRRDDKTGPKSRIPAPKSLSQTSRSRSFSNLSNGCDNDNAFRQQSVDSRLNGSSNGDPFDDELSMINSRTPQNESANDYNRSQSKTPVPKLANPLTTGRQTFLNNGRENTRTPKLVRAVSSDMLSSLSGSSQTLHTLDDEEYV